MSSTCSVEGSTPPAATRGFSTPGSGGLATAFAAGFALAGALGGTSGGNGASSGSRFRAAPERPRGLISTGGSGAGATASSAEASRTAADAVAAAGEGDAGDDAGRSDWTLGEGPPQGALAASCSPRCHAHPGAAQHRASAIAAAVRRKRRRTTAADRSVVKPLVVPLRFATASVPSRADPRTNRRPSATHKSSGESGTNLTTFLKTQTIAARPFVTRATGGIQQGVFRPAQPALRAGGSSRTGVSPAGKPPHADRHRGRNHG